MKSAWSFGKLFLFSPAAAADACARAQALHDGLKVYAAFALVELLSYRLNGLAFLDPGAASMSSRGLSFWLNVALWEPVLFALSVFFTVLVLEWMRAGWLPLKTALATAWSGVPAAIALDRAQFQSAAGHRALILLLIAWFTPAALLAWRIPRARWRSVGAFLLGLNAVQLVCLIIEYTTVVPLRSTVGFYALSLLSIVWLLVCAGVGLRNLYATSTARVVLGFLFAVLVSSAAPALVYVAGLMPKEVLKALLYV